jgi:Ribonuclease HepT-like
MLLFALIRAVEVLGEAGAKLSDDTRALDSTIPWGAIVSMRNRLIHGYFDIDADIVLEDRGDRAASASSGSSMLAITRKRPPQRAHCSIWIPNTRFRRRAHVIATRWGIGGSGAAARLRDAAPLPAGVIAARNAACAANTP